MSWSWMQRILGQLVMGCLIKTSSDGYGLLVALIVMGGCMGVLSCIKPIPNYYFVLSLLLCLHAALLASWSTVQLSSPPQAKLLDMDSPRKDAAASIEEDNECNQL